MDWSDTENMRPLKTGRSFKSNVQRTEVASRLALQITDKKRAEMQQQIDTYSGDDPLPLWASLVKFVSQEYKTGNKSLLVPLLERCTRELQATGRYRDDIRYLRIWIEYADNLADPGEVFTFLEDNGIGHRHALLYEAHASFLERAGAHTQAHRTFELGISRFAAPLTRLQVKFDDFKTRMQKREERQAQGGLSIVREGALDTAERPASRMTFAELPKSRPRDGQRPGHAFLPSRGLVGTKRSAAAAGVAASDNVDVFVDEEFGGEASDESYQAPRSRITSVVSAEDTHKENTAVAQPMAKGLHLPRRQGGGAAQPAPELEIFIDDDLAEAPTVQVSVRRNLDNVTPLQAAPKGDSLRTHHEPTALSFGARAADAIPSSTSQPKMAPTMIFDVQSLVNSQGRELCFEELRAEHMRRQATPPTAAEPNNLSQGQPPLSSNYAAPNAVAVSRSSSPTATHRAAPATDGDTERTLSALPPTIQALPAAGRWDPHPDISDENANPVDTTAAAKVAYDENKSSDTCAEAPRTILGPCSNATSPDSNATMPHGLQQQDHLAEFDNGGAGGSVDDTTSFDAFGGAFSGTLPEALPAGIEPTVTINTLAAYSDMNDMFQSALPHTATHTRAKPAVQLPPRPPGNSRRKSGAFVLRTPRQSSVLPPYATQPLPALHELKQSVVDGNMTTCFGTTSRGLQQDREHVNTASATASEKPDENDETGLVYEDTEFLPTFGGADSGSSGLGEEDGSILIREDTQFLPQGAANDNAHHDAQPGTMPASPSGTLFAESIPHQAVLATSTAASKNARIIDAVLPAPAAVEPDSVSGFHDEVPFDDKENIGVEQFAVASRRYLPMSQALQPCSHTRGIEIGTGYASDEDDTAIAALLPPLLRLTQAGSSLQDDFEVFSDVK